jgi:hypothetical protein
MTVSDFAEAIFPNVDDCIFVIVITSPVELGG